MGIANNKALIYFLIASFSISYFVFGDKLPPNPKDSHFIYLKSVSCKYNPKFLGNVTCFAKSYGRRISKATVKAIVKETVTSVVVNRYLIVFLLVFKFQVIRSWTSNYNTSTEQSIAMFYVFQKSMTSVKLCATWKNIRRGLCSARFIKYVAEDSLPGFLRPCPWKVVA